MTIKFSYTSLAEDRPSTKFLQINENLKENFALSYTFPTLILYNIYMKSIIVISWSVVTHTELQGQGCMHTIIIILLLLSCMLLNALSYGCIWATVCTACYVSLKMHVIAPHKIIHEAMMQWPVNIKHSQNLIIFWFIGSYSLI